MFFTAYSTGLRISRPIGKEDAIGTQGKHILRARLPRDNGHETAYPHQVVQNVPLDTIVIGNNFELRDVVAGGRRPGVWLRAGDGGSEITADHACGTARARTTSRCTSRSSELTMPRSAPLVRMWRTKARVSISVRPTILCLFR